MDITQRQISYHRIAKSFFIQNIIVTPAILSSDIGISRSPNFAVNASVYNGKTYEKEHTRKKKRARIFIILRYVTSYICNIL